MPQALLTAAALFRLLLGVLGHIAWNKAKGSLKEGFGHAVGDNRVEGEGALDSILEKRK